MKYNIYFELAAAALLVVLNLYVYLQYPSDSPSNRHFKRLAGVLFLAVTLDVVTAITISYADSVPIWLNTALNTIYLISDVFLECQFVIYCTCAIYGTARHRHIPEFTLGAAKGSASFRQAVKMPFRTPGSHLPRIFPLRSGSSARRSE